MISGVVRDDHGDPVAGAHVEYIAQHTVGTRDELGMLALGNVSTRTDRAGHYELRGVSRPALTMGRPELFATTDDGLASVPIEPPDSDASRDLQLSATGTIVVTVTGARPMSVVASAHRIRRLGFTKDGVAEFDHLPVDTYQVTAVGADRATHASQTVDVHANKVESITIALPAPTPVSVEITSTKHECTEIQIRDLEQNEVALAPCSKRVAAFPAVAPGDYLACIDRKLCIPVFVDPSPAQQKIDIPRSDR